MIKFGTLDVSDVYKGNQAFAKSYIGGSLVFQKTSSIQYITDGLVADFRGEDNYVDGSWVDRVSGYKFTPVSTSTAPVHDSTNKLYQATSFGGMKSDFTTGTTFTLEFTFRDVKNMVKASSTNYATLVAGNMSGYDQKNGVYIVKKQSTEELSIFTKNGTTTSSSAIYSLGNLPDNSLDTITFSIGVGIFHNGVKLSDCSKTITSGNIGLFTFYDQTNASSYKAKGKIHAVRKYNRALTAEEVLQNYNADVSIYGA